MAERDTFVSVNDGDQLNDGYFNGILTATTIEFTILPAINYALDGATVTNQDNLIIEDFDDMAQIDETNTTCSISTGLELAFSGAIYDTYSDSSQDSNKWTTDITAGETAGNDDDITGEGYTQATHSASDSKASAYLEGEGATSTMDLKPASGTDAECIVHIAISSGDGGNANIMEARLELYDESSNAVTVWKSGPGSGNKSISGAVRLVFRSGDNCDVYRDSTSLSATVDTSSLTGSKWFLRGYCADNSGDIADRAYSIKFRKVRRANNSHSISATYFYSAAQTIASSSILVIKYLLGNGTYTLQHSFDNGSNYDTVTHKTITTITNAGTQSKAKVTLPSGTLTYLPKITGFGYYYS